MAQQQTSSNNPPSSATSNSNVSNLYPLLESKTAALDENEKNLSILEIERELVACIKKSCQAKDLLEDIADRSIVPEELLQSFKRLVKPKIDPLKRLQELPTEEVEEDDEQEEEDEDEDEEQEVVDDEEEDAGGDYLVSHFDNGIGLSYWYYGILQERITRSKHEPGGEMFTCTMTLVLLQCIFNAIFAKFILTFIFKQGRDRTRALYYGICSLTYLTAMVSSNMALRHVNYPTQVIGKSCKPIPIMILGVLIGGKRHALKKYIFIFLIVIGVALFMYKKDISISNALLSNPLQYSTSTTSLTSLFGAGEMLLVLSLSMDGITGAIQERMKAEHATKSAHMMFKVNLWSTVYLSVATLLTGELFQFYEFILRHQNLVSDIILFSSLSAIGQLFIFLTVAEFGPLPCSVVTTTRKFFTVLTSVFLFGNKLTTTQWLGTALVFFGLSLDAIYGKEAKSATKIKSN